MIDDPALMASRVARLTPRQVAIMRMVCAGDRLGTIAHRLGISMSTAKNHVSDTRQMLRATGMSHAAAIFVLGGGLKEKEADE